MTKFSKKGKKLGAVGGIAIGLAVTSVAWACTMTISTFQVSPKSGSRSSAVTVSVAGTMAYGWLAHPANRELYLASSSCPVGEPSSASLSIPSGSVNLGDPGPTGNVVIQGGGEYWTISGAGTIPPSTSRATGLYRILAGAQPHYWCTPFNVTI